MKKSIAFTIAFLALSFGTLVILYVRAGPTTDDFFPALESVTPELGYATAIFQFHNPTAAALTLNKNILNSYALQAQGKNITSIQYFYFGNVSTQNCTDNINTTQRNVWNTNSSTWYNYTTSVYINTTCLNYTYQDWVPFTNLNVNANQTVRFKVVLYHDIVLGPESFDWIPQVTYSGTNYSKTSWQWMNSSWNLRQAFTSTNAMGVNLNNFRVYVNFSNSKITQGVMFANCSDIRVGNGTTQFQMYFENCNSASGINIYGIIPNYIQGVNTFYVYYNGMALGDTRNVSIMNSSLFNVTVPTAFYGGGGLAMSTTKMYYSEGYGTSYSNKVGVINMTTSTQQTDAGTLTSAISEAWGVGMNNSLYSFGGDNASGGPSKQIVRFNMSDESVTRLNWLTTGRRSACTAGLNNEILVIGGDSGAATLSSIERYWVGNNTKTAFTGTLQLEREPCWGFPNLNRVYVMGGLLTTTPQNKIYVIYPNNMTVVDTTKTINVSITAAGYGGYDSNGGGVDLMYSIGGSLTNGGIPVKYVSEYNITSNTVVMTNFTEALPRGYPRCSTIDKSIFCIGGSDGAKNLNTIERLDMRIPCAMSGSEEAYKISPIFASPTPANQTTNANKYVYVNATKTSGNSAGITNCTLNWINSSASNMSMTISADKLFCYLNVTITAGQTVWYMVYMQASNDGLMNVTEQRQYINSGSIPISGCGSLSTANTLYMLTTDITDSGINKCMNVTANNVTLDCGWKKIDGTDTSSTYGIYLTSGTYGAVIQNCTITDWDTGIYGVTSTNDTIINVNISSNSLGIYSYLNSIWWNATNITGVLNSFGIYIGSGQGIFKNINITDSSNVDVTVGDYIEACNSTWININVSGGRQAILYNYSQKGSNVKDLIVGELYVCAADNSIFTNITVWGGGTNNEIELFYADNVTLSNINTTGVRRGLGMVHANLNKINNSYFILNMGPPGLWIQDSKNNSFTNVTILTSGNGVNLYYDSDYNLINNSNIKTTASSPAFYIYSLSDASTPRFNNIYNNIINSTIHYGSSGSTPSASQNFLNTTKMSGTNIVGGPYIGGNYWTNASGNNYSDTCVDVSPLDGICDNSYTIGINNTDYLPLAKYSAIGPCTCPGSGNNWAIDMSQNCVLSATCNLGAGNLTFTSTGNFYVNALLNCYSMGNIAASQMVWMQASGFINTTK